MKQNENNEVLAQLHIARHNINNMENHNKDLEKIIIEKDYLQFFLIQMDANYWKFKLEKDFLNVEHNKLQKGYKNMKLLKQQKKLEELRKEIGNVCQREAI